MLEWAQCGFHEKRTGTCYAELVFLYLVGSVSHVVHFSVSGPRNINTLFFMHGCARCGFLKKCIATCYAELLFLRSGRVTSMHYFSCSGRTGTDSTKSTSQDITLNLGFCIQWDLRVT
jgi:hypothetical protein